MSNNGPPGTERMSNSPDKGPVELIKLGLSRLRTWWSNGSESDTEDTSLEDVSDDAIEDAAFEIRQRASYIGWTDQEREEEYLTIADHLLEQRDGGDEA